MASVLTGHVPQAMTPTPASWPSYSTSVAVSLRRPTARGETGLNLERTLNNIRTRYSLKRSAGGTGSGRGGVDACACPRKSALPSRGSLEGLRRVGRLVKSAVHVFGASISRKRLRFRARDRDARHAGMSPDPACRIRKGIRAEIEGAAVNIWRSPAVLPHRVRDAGVGEPRFPGSKVTTGPLGVIGQWHSSTTGASPSGCSSGSPA
jgi:hypothetical protein